MNEWGFLGQDTLVALGKYATINKFKQQCGFEQMERLVLSNPALHIVCREAMNGNIYSLHAVIKMVEASFF